MKSFIRAEKHLILTAPDTEFENFLSELDQLSEREPEILDKIEQDLEKYARNKKKERLRVLTIFVKFYTLRRKTLINKA